ncbi:MAG TPA: hypothetical protein DDW52_27535 [Planctomycetaceae bacterium]|nr:hypothetical protein [Planctomycetaceae bacterium]
MVRFAIAVLVLTQLFGSGCGKRLLPRPAVPARTQDAHDTVDPSSQNKASDASGIVEPDERQKPSEFARQLSALRSGESSLVHLVREPLAADELNELLDEVELLDLLLDAGGPSDAELGIIGKLPKLEHLRIRQSQITDEGIKSFCDAGPLQLQILNLPQANITELGIQHLKRLPNLTNLRLGGEQIDDVAVIAISQLPRLKSLHLIGPSLTAEGLKPLAFAPRLASLYIDDCDLPDRAWEELFSAKPNLHVHIDQQHHDRDPKHHEHD